LGRNPFLFATVLLDFLKTISSPETIEQLLTPRYLAPGSAEVEKLWEDYYKNDARIPTQPTEFDGRSDYGPFLDFGIASGGLSSGADGVKTEEEVALYGGTAGQIYDPNYHTAQDILANTNVGVWIQMAKGIAHAVATYGRSFETLPAKTKRSEKREVHMYQRKGGKWVY
jgi:Zn-dependent M28 family amino/carboxypeptidase